MILASKQLALPIGGIEYDIVLDPFSDYPFDPIKVESDFLSAKDDFLQDPLIAYERQGFVDHFAETNCRRSSIVLDDVQFKGSLFDVVQQLEAEEQAARAEVQPMQRLCRQEDNHGARILKKRKSEVLESDTVEFFNIVPPLTSRSNSWETGSNKKRRSKWAPEDIRTLWEGILRHGSEWREIKQLLPERTYDQVKDKGRRMLQQQRWKTGRSKTVVDGASEEAKQIARLVLGESKKKRPVS